MPSLRLMLRTAVCACAMAVLPLSLLAQNLEIHVINVGWGGALLVRGPDGTTVLMDAGNTGKGSAEVVPYLQSIGITPAVGIDYTIAGHQHCDHIGGMDEVVNAGYDVTTRNYYNGSSYSSSCVTGWNAAAATTSAGAPVAMPVGTEILLGSGAKLTCIARNGSIVGSGSVSVSDENDRSIAVLVQYGGFDFVWASDLGGGSIDNSCTGRSTSQVDVETAVIQAISPGGAAPMISSGGIDVLYCNHHGSESSTNMNWMNYSQPAVALISTGAGQTSGWDLPRKDVVENVLLAQATSCITVPAAEVFQTEEGNPTGSLTSFAGYCVGNISVSTDGMSTFTVSGDGAVNQGPNELAASGLPKIYNLDDVPDTTPPVISSVSAGGITSSTAEITWTTDEFANSTVDYGLTTAYGSTSSDPAYVTSHSITLTGLSENTLYHYRVQSTDGAGNTGFSSDFTFETTSETAATLVESFTDGDFTSNPSWGGTTSRWQVVASSDVAAGAANSSTLRLNASSGSGTRYLRTQRSDSWGTEQSWSFWMGRRAQAATDANHSIVWLWANGSNLTSSTVDGYRVRFGDNSGGDNIVLQSVTNGTATDILTSSGTVPNALTDIGFMVRVTRTSSSQWTLYTSTLPTSSGSGAVATAIPTAANTPVNQGSVTNSTYTNFTNGYFGFAAVHSTSADARTGAEFDQLYFDTSASSPLGRPVFVDPAPAPSVAASSPEGFQLHQNFPNPFNPATTIAYELTSDARVRLTVFNAIGQQVALLADGLEQAGYKQVRFEAPGLPSGVYFYRLQVDGVLVETRKMVLQR